MNPSDLEPPAEPDLIERRLLGSRLLSAGVVGSGLLGKSLVRTRSVAEVRS